MRVVVINLVILLALGLASCHKKPSVKFVDFMSTEQLIESSKNSAEKAQRLTGRSAKSRIKELATEGKIYANKCVEIAPKEPRCYYWRAVNTGLYIQVKIRGYQKAIKQMLSDCEKVIELGSENYDHGGPYRIQGEIYTLLPQTAGRPDSITRDLDKGEKLLRKAVELAPNYPENLVALGRNLYMQDRFDEALRELNKADAHVDNWKNDSSYREWQHSISHLRNKIN